MITKITGRLEQLGEEQAIVNIAPFEYQVLIPEFTRRQLQLKIGSEIQLHTIQYLEGNPAQGGRLTPRMIGFLSEIEREFFDVFCSVDGVGVKKALRAMVRPVQEVAALIESQDAKGVATLPGIGPATAERIIAKLRRKMAKFALLVKLEMGEGAEIEHDIAEETYQLLCTLGHTDPEARKLVDSVLQSKKKFKDVESMIQAVYQQTHP